MIELRMIIPPSAITPSSATKPNGAWKINSAGTTPMSASGPVRNTMNSREKLCSWIISNVSITMTITGKRMKIEALPLADSSKAPPGSIR